LRRWPRPSCFPRIRWRTSRCCRAEPTWEA
jgi:hypothetical protein